MEPQPCTPHGREPRTSERWTDERIDVLKRLWTEGLSCSQIANRLGDGATRNGVIGKVHRLNLETRKVEARTTPKSYRRPTKQKREMALALPTPSVAVTPLPALKVKPETTDGRKRGGVSYSAIANAAARAKPVEAPPKRRGKKMRMITDLGPRDCRFPHGDPRDKAFHFCARHVEQEESPYCNYHRTICYQPLERPAWRARP